ncbi:MAG: hypothetical protein V1744_00950 [Candidatus Altiarchaeota archaeon]
MISDEEFMQKAKRLLKLEDKPEEEMSDLKKANIILLERELSRVVRSLEAADRQLKAGRVSQEKHAIICHDLTAKKKDIDSERQMLDLLQSKEYLDHLQRLVDAKKYEEYGKPKTPSEEDRTLLRAILSAAALAILSSAAGLLLSSPFLVVALPVIVIFFIVAFTLILHISTDSVGVREAAVEKAFTCVTSSIISTLALGLTVYALALVIVLFIGSKGLAAKMLDLNFMASTLSTVKVMAHTIFILSNFALLALSVSTVYQTRPKNAIEAVILSYAAGIVVWLLAALTVLRFL